MHRNRERFAGRADDRPALDLGSGGGRASGPTEDNRQGQDQEPETTSERHRPKVDRGPGFKPWHRGATRAAHRALGREQEPEGRAAVRSSRPRWSPVHLHELLAEGQPQPGALGPPAGGAVHLAELLEQLGHVLPLDADALVRHRDPDHLLGDQPGLVAGPLGRLPSGARVRTAVSAILPAFGGELGRVGEEVEQDLPDPDAVGHDGERCRVELEVHSWRLAVRRLAVSATAPVMASRRSVPASVSVIRPASILERSRTLLMSDEQVLAVPQHRLE